MKPPKAPKAKAAPGSSRSKQPLISRKKKVAKSVVDPKGSKGKKRKGKTGGGSDATAAASSKKKRKGK